MTVRRSHTFGVRWLITVILVGVMALGFGQGEEGKQEIPFATPPQVFIVVKKPEMGSDMVTVTVRDPGYSPSLLQLQATLVGKFAGSEIRGLQVKPMDLGSESGDSVLRATFACDGLIDRQNDRLNIDALVKAFLGSSTPMISSFLIHFDGEKVSPNSLQSYVDEAVMVEGKILQEPDGIEYRVEVLTQDTRLIAIPGSLSEMPDPVKKPATPSGLPPFVLPILISGIVIAGALVYFALLRPGQKNRKK